MTIEQIRILVEERGLKLLSSEYVDRRSPLKIFCPVHGEFETKYINFRLGNICSKCGYSNGAKAQTLKIEEVQSRIRELGYVPLFSEYKNAKQKLLISCPAHGEFEASFDNLSQGKKCAKCSDDSKRENKSTIKKTYEYVNKVFAEQGYTLLDKEYVNSKFKMSTICPNNHTYIVSFDLFGNRNLRCPTCSGNKKRTVEEVKEVFLKQGYTPLFTEYIKNTKPVEVMCPGGHVWSPTLNNFLKGVRCPSCNGITTKHKIESVKEVIERSGYKLVSYDYVNSLSKLDTICPNGHNYSVRFSDFKTGYRCAECANLKPYGLEKAREEFKKHGYDLEDKEWNGYSAISNTVCDKGHKYRVSLAHFKSHGSRCLTCNNTGTSKAEIELSDWVKTYFPLAKKIKLENGKVRSFSELDIFIPELNIAIEYNGLYWHSDIFQHKTYHSEKMAIANKNGIRLITIFEDEWRDRKDQVKGFLLSALSKNSKKIYARNCEVRVVEKTNAVAFLDDNHIQGSTVFQASIGLYHNDELVGLITGNKHHRQGHDSKFVLNRLVFKRDYSIAGGSSRLLKYLIKYAKDHGFNEIISWSDNRWSEGNVYKSLGFTLEEVLIPDYSYVKGPNRMSKQSCQKKLLTKKGAVGDSESEMAKSLGYNRIWDCGKIRWKLPLR